MSKIKIITLICWLITALILIGLVIWFLTGSLLGLKTGLTINNPFSNISIGSLSGPYNEVGSYTVPANGIETLNVNWVAGKITITPYDGNVIKFTEFAQRDLNEKEKLTYTNKNGKLEISYVTSSLTFNMLSKNLELLVPEQLAHQLNQLNVNATSADLTLTDFEVNSLDVEETSGTSDISNIKATSVNMHSVSGTIKVTGLSASGLTLSTVSGELELLEVTTDTLKSGTTSGDQHLSGTFKDIDAGSVSGDITISSSNNPDKLYCETISGDILMTIPGNTDLTVSYSTVSGKFNSEVPAKTGGSAPYTFSSVSGDIDIKESEQAS